MKGKAKSRSPKKGRIRRLFLWMVLSASLFYGLQTEEGIHLKQQVTAQAVRIWPIYQRYWGPYFVWANQQKEQFIARVRTAHKLIAGDAANNRLHFIFNSTTTRKVA